MRYTLLALVCAAVSPVAVCAFARPTIDTRLDRAGDMAVYAAAVSGPVADNGVTKVRLGSLYRDSLVVTDVALPVAGGTITNLVAGDNIVIDSPAPGVRRISATASSVPSGWETVSNAALTAFSRSTNYTDAAILSRIAEDIEDESFDKALSAYNGAFLYEIVTNINERENGTWLTVSTYIPYLEHYATNNYKAARIANERATNLELWRRSVTNDLLSATNPIFSNAVRRVASELIKTAVSGLDGSSSVADVITALKAIGD